VKVTLKQGTFEIDATALNKKMANPRPQVQSDVTCSIAASGSGLVRLFNGTGLYQGISGSANVTMTFTGVGGRYYSGAKKGQCEQGNGLRSRCSARSSAAAASGSTSCSSQARC
jgi:hypothetical protein